jgi:hypothetical protein
MLHNSQSRIVYFPVPSPTTKTLQLVLQMSEFKEQTHDEVNVTGKIVGCHEDFEQHWLLHCHQHHVALFSTFLIQGAAFNVTHFESRITYLLYTAINTTEHG